MSELAIRIQGLGKRYRIGRQERYKSLRDSLVRALRAPWEKLKRGFAPGDGDSTFWALKDLDLEIRRGDVIGVIGRNGAGKSTLLKILSRITDPTEGRAEIMGRVGSLLEVGTGFHPELTGRENIYLNGAILGMRRGEIQDKFDEIVAFAEMEKFLDTQVKHYSSGMYMRLAFAVAAHLEPEVLLVDEVLAVGDAAFQKKCLGKMSDVAKQGRTVLFVSHNMGAVSALCKAVVLLEGGRLAAHSTDTQSVISKYLFGAAEDHARARWSSDGQQFDNPWFKPLSFYLTDEAGQALGPSTPNDQAVQVHLVAEVAELDPALTIGYAIYDEHGQLLYWSYQTDSAPDQWPALRTGQVHLVSTIPAHFLNEGSYRLELTGGLHFRHWLFEPGKSAPSIFLTIHGGLSDSPYWYQRRPGILAPIMSWKTQ